MSDDEIKDKQPDTTRTEPDSLPSETTPPTTSAATTDEASASLEDELPEKSAIDIELERVESIENKDVATDEASASEAEADTETAAPTETDASEPAQLPVSLPEDNNKKVSLDDIIQRHGLEKKAHKKPVVWIILTLLFFLLAAGLAGLYAYTSHQQASQQQALQSEIDQQRATSQDLSQQLQAAQKSLAAAKDKATATQSAVDYRQIPEWDVRYKQTDVNRDLTYSYSLFQEAGMAIPRLSFSTPVISAIADKQADAVSYPCGPQAAPLGWIARYTKEQLAAAKQAVAGTPQAKVYDAAIKQGDVYYLTGTAQAACSTELTSVAKYQELVKLVQALPQQFETISQPAKQQKN